MFIHHCKWKTELTIITDRSQAQRNTPIIPVIWWTKTEDHTFKAKLGNSARPCLKITIKKSWDIAQWLRGLLVMHKALCSILSKAKNIKRINMKLM